MSAPTSASKPCKIMPDFTFIAVSLIQTDHGNVDGRDPVEITLQTRLRKFSSIIDSDGAGLWSHGEWWSFGVAPTAAAIPELMAMVSTNAGKTIWNTQDIRGETGNLDEYGTRVAGLLAIPISVSSPDFLVFFRTEEAHQVEWAGEPRKLEQLTENGVRLSPRGSFDTVAHRDGHRGNAEIAWRDGGCGSGKRRCGFGNHRKGGSGLRRPRSEPRGLDVGRNGRTLGRLSIPYVFATGYRDGSSMPEGFGDIPVVRKPVSEYSLATVLGKALDLHPE